MPHSPRARTRVALLAVATILVGCGPSSAASPAQQLVAAASSPERIEPCRPRFAWQRPVIAVVGVNSGTEKRAGGQSQFSVPLAAQTRYHDFVELHAWMAANLAADLSVPRLAKRACMASRTFARVYAGKVGRTPAKTVELMRVEAACRALGEIDLPLKAVAVQSGYGDEQKLRRAFQRQLGSNPAAHRARFSRHHQVSASLHAATARVRER